MAALSMRGKQDISAFLESFEGSNRYILDYLLEEVLEQQPPEVQCFLIHTSILRTLCGDLCDCVTGERGSRTTLQALEDANLFLIPLDDAREWYRYHHLLSSLLVHRLSTENPVLACELHARASAWYQENGMLLEAVHHALQCKEIDRTVALIEQHAIGLVYQGANQTLARWLSQLPPGVVHSRPLLNTARAWASIFNGDQAGTRRHLQEAHEALASHPPAEVQDRKAIEGQIQAIESYLAWFEGEIPRAIELAQAALKNIPPEDSLPRAWALLLTGALIRAEGEFNQAEGYLIEAAQMNQRLGAIQTTLDAIWELTVLDQYQGKLSQVKDRCHEALALVQGDAHFGRRQVPALSYIHTRLALIHFEWNELQLASEHAHLAAAIAQRWGMIDALVMSNNVLAQVLRTEGDFSAALEALASSKQASIGISEWYTQIVEANEARTYLRAGSYDAVERWVAGCGLSFSDDVPFHREDEYRTLIHVALALARKKKLKPSKELLGLLDRIETLYQSCSAEGPLIDVIIQKALAFDLQGDSEAALQTLTRALLLGQQERYLGTFLKYGEPLEAMLAKLPHEGISPNYLGELLGAFHPQAIVTQAATSGSLLLVEPLSERELDVLRYLNSALTSAEIADELYVAVSTVRSHIKSIYQKLGVHRRIEAVECARELGLL